MAQCGMQWLAKTFNAADATVDGGGAAKKRDIYDANKIQHFKRLDSWSLVFIHVIQNRWLTVWLWIQFGQYMQ